MKIIYKDLLKLLNHQPSKEELSERLFQLGHEHEIDNDIFEMELTPNRGDCFSILGLARDLNIFFGFNKDNIEIYNKPINELNIKFKNLSKSNCPKISFLEIKIADNDFSYAPYLEQYFKIFKINKTNFFTDVSNYLSYELGQPTHCYDKSKIKNEICLQDIKLEENFKTVLGNEIILKNNNLVFSMKDKVINLAGVMGGEATSCEKGTNHVLVECAYFNPESILGKSVNYNIISDAAHKFERGVDISSQEYVLRRFIKIVSDHTELLDLKIKTFEYSQISKREINYDLNKINNILGTDLDKIELSKYLESLGLNVSDKIKVPHHRHDIHNQNDIAEEIARLIGYDNIKSKPFEIKIDPTKNKSSKINILRNYLSKNGFSEVINFPFAHNNKNSKNSIKVVNPLDSNKNYLRLSLQSSLLDNLIYNERRQHESIKIFELSDIYFKEKEIKNVTKLGILASGRQGENYRDFTKKIDDKFLNNQLKKLGLEFSEIDRSFINSKNKNKIYYCEFSIDNIPKEFYINEVEASNNINFINYKKVSNYPASSRDISFSITNMNLVDEIINHYKNVSHENLKNLFMFDFFINKKTKEVKIGYRFIFQSNEETLTDSQINKYMKELISPVILNEGIEVPGM